MAEIKTLTFENIHSAIDVVKALALESYIVTIKPVLRTSIHSAHEGYLIEIHKKISEKKFNIQTEPLGKLEDVL